MPTLFEQYCRVRAYQHRSLILPDHASKCLRFGLCEAFLLAFEVQVL